MNTDKNFARRMVVSKYNNRPPFDLKKPVQSYEIQDKIRNYPEEACKNCCRNRSTEKSIIEFAVRRPKSPSPEQDNKSKNSSLTTIIIPKIIENFKKITPTSSQVETPIMKQKNTSSVQTLYRNKKACRLGKNIPKHKLMKSLLNNLEDRSNPGRTRFRRNASDSDEGVKLTSEESFQSSNKASPDNSSTYCNIPGKVNRKTSTSELLWPLKSKEMLHYASQRNLLLKPKNCSTIQEEGRKSNSFSSESFLKEAPTKDVTIEPTKRTQKSFVKPKGKTFVQSQVEKLDKVLRVPPKPPQATQFLGKVKSGNYQSRVEKSGQAYARKNEITCGYMKIMDRVKNNCPHIKEPVKYSNFASDHSWSDSSPESDPELVRFPRETRTAMGQCLRDQRQPVPLSKYSNISHNNFAPAIPRYSQYVDPNNYNHADPDSSFYYNQEAQVRRTTSLKVRESKKTVPGRSSRVKLPCKKNLLCDQGETHDGPCGYTRSSHNRVIY